MPAKRILVVEDEPSIAETLVHVLQEQGFDTTGVGARRNLNFALLDISSSIYGRIRLFYVNWQV